MLQKIISGGQTGVDRAGLDAALSCHFPTGGWCPKGRRAEDGPISPEYPLIETPETDYQFRTAKNITESDGTLVIIYQKPDAGTRLTINLAKKTGKPFYIVKLDQNNIQTPEIIHWINNEKIKVLNVAGPRESFCPGIYERAYQSILEILKYFNS